MTKVKRWFLFMGATASGLGLSLLGAPKSQFANPYMNMLASETFATDAYADGCYQECNVTGGVCVEASDEYYCTSGGGWCHGKLGCS